jgi:prepilin-type N-terminal cleavage/methylation domain-containing protein
MSSRPPQKNAGFTLIEILIVVVVSLLLSTIAIGYSGIGRDQVALSVETTKLSQFILQARSLSIATYGNVGGTCAYGVAFNAASGTYSIFGYTPAGMTSCPSAASGKITAASILSDQKMYTGGTSGVHVGNGVVMSTTGNDVLSAVLFYPPNPRVFIVCSDGSFCSFSGKVYLGTADGSMSRTITVDQGGQVNF